VEDAAADTEAAAGPAAAETRLARLRVVLAVATLAMLGLSWPLWVENGAFPRVPFIPRLPEVPAAASWLLYLVLLGAIAASARAGGRAWRDGLGVSFVLLVGLVLGDQHRFQPWVYQYLMLALIVATLPPETALRYARWWFAALYLHSGLSKLDVSFCHEMGAVFLATALRSLGIVPHDWPAAWRTAAVLAMPAWEIAVAAALVVPRTRRLGLAGALILHGALLGILGPWGLGHSTIVLVWNAAMMIEAALLFGPRDTASAADPVPARSVRLVGRVAQAVFWAAVVLPLGERWGVFDAWPAHALYASHVERTVVYVHEDGLDALPTAARRHVGPGDFGPWRRLDLTGWSRAVRGVPVYPQGRACNGLAEALAARYGGRLPVRVIHWGRADRWTGQRSRVELLGLAAIRRRGSRYRLNAHPSAWFTAAQGAARRKAGPRFTTPIPVRRVSSCGSLEPAGSCCTRPRSPAATALATSDRKRTPSSGSSPRPASAGGRSCRWVRQGSTTRPTSRTRPTRAIPC
jgi:hypothetical protein